MNNKNWLFLLLFGLMTWTARAGNAHLFRYNQAVVDQALATVNVVDNYVTAHHITADQLNFHDNLLLRNFDDESINLFDKGPDELLGIPPFWWGFVLSWVGILVVYFLTDKNKEYTKEALIGCVVNALIWGGLYFVGGGCWAWWL